MTSELKDKLLEKFKDKNISLNENREQLIMTVPVEAWLDSAFQLRDNPDFSFEVLIDLAGVDYSTYKDTLQQGPRFCVVYQFLSLKYNQRLRVKVFAENSAWPSVPSVVEVWSSANWYEREAYDLYGILFEGHPDLRRLLTDYGFVGHPFRKDFPITGHVEMRYDPEQKRVIYQPVTIEPRENTPRIVREDQYARFIQ